MQRRPATAAVLAATLSLAATVVLLGSTGLTDRGLQLDAAHPRDSVADAVPQAQLQAGQAAAVRRLLRPDMFSLRARQVSLRPSGGHRVLFFAAMLADGGRGPMVVKPRPRRDCPPGQRLARQILFVDRNGDGRFQRGTDTGTRSRRAGCVLDHPTHHHWHFDAMAAYRLVDPTPRRRVVVGRPKVSFCLRDNQPIPGTRPRQRRAYFGECGRTQVQGISPGWVDLYDASTPGQSLRLPDRMPDGVYCLVLRADPRNQLLETDESNNARARPLRIRGNRVGFPKVRTCRGIVG